MKTLYIYLLSYLFPIVTISFTGHGVDCQVGEWEEWTECDNPCGYGSRKRKRVVTQYPDNGGTNCPILKQRRACVGFEEEVCKQNLVNEMTIEKAEQARILPIEFGRYRTEKKYDPWKGILKNLYSKYFNEILTRPSYSGKFKITSTHHGCESSEWAKHLTVNSTICVECQPVAMNRETGMRCLGHGVYNIETAWKAVDVPHCHGTWELTGQHQPDVCHYDVEEEDKKNFIFL
nr:somatomedin-B and thrombospondin type-1 domain-containing protein-like [Biomphalaria glabrata]